MPIEPDERQLGEIAAGAGGPDDGPVVMINLNRYRERAVYERYGEVALGVLERVGGRILWHARANETVIGDDSDLYDEVIAVWYPSRAAFVELATSEEVMAVREHRAAGLERAALICCEPLTEPALA
jgi:uncharacterized protein (DUF1330 family)